MGATIRLGDLETMTDDGTAWHGGPDWLNRSAEHAAKTARVYYSPNPVYAYAVAIAKILGGEVVRVDPVPPSLPDVIY